MKRVSLDPAAARLIADQARAGYPDEICGALVGSGTAEGLLVTRAIPIENEADAAIRRRRFTLDPREVLRIERELRGGPDRLLGFYHSHPDAEAVPSSTDMTFIRLWPETVWIIVKVRQGAPDPPRAWWLDDPEGAAAVELAVS